MQPFEQHGFTTQYLSSRGFFSTRTSRPAHTGPDRERHRKNFALTLALAFSIALRRVQYRGDASHGRADRIPHGAAVADFALASISGVTIYEFQFLFVDFQLSWSKRADFGCGDFRRVVTENSSFCDGFVV